MKLNWIPGSPRILMTLVAASVVVSPLAVGQTGMTLSFPDEAYGPYVGTVTATSESIENLDVYIPSDPGPRPVLIEVHGGGWSKGKKGAFSSYHQNSSGVGIIEKAYAEGWAVVTVNYPLVALLGDPNFPNNTWPTPLDSVRRAVQFVRQQAATNPGWRLDTQRMVGIGGSAGGHLLYCTAFLSDGSNPGSSDPVEHYSTRLSGVIGGWTATSVSKHHALGTTARPALWELFGVTSATEFNGLNDCVTYQASPTFLATHDGATLQPSPTLSAMNAMIPIRGLYATSAVTCSNGFTWPTANAHGYQFGVLLQDAFQTSYCANPCHTTCQNTPPTVTCGGAAEPDWADFGIIPLPPIAPTQQQINDFSDETVEFLGPLAEHTVASVSPESGTMPAPFTISWHVNLGPTDSGDFALAASANPTQNKITLALGANGIPPLLLDYATLLAPNGDPLHTLWAQNISIASHDNTLVFTLNIGVDFMALASLGINQVTAGVQVMKAGVPQALAVATYGAP